MAKHDGVKHQLGGVEMTVPGLSLGALRRFSESGKLKVAQGGSMSPEEITSQVEIIAAALQRNHPEATEEWVAENIDTRSVIAVIRTIFNATGLQAPKPGEAPSP